jgi:uncharacterized membrane protein
MPNLSFSENNSMPLMMSLDEFLNSLGYNDWLTVTASFILPIISLIGMILCSLSAFIFFQKKFVDPVFFYYRLLCLVNILHLAHGIPYGLLFSPRYFSQIIDTYLSAIYQSYYQNVSIFLYHFEDTLQLAILLTRMTIFSPFLKRKFTSRPWVVSLAFFLTCLCIEAPLVFDNKIESMGTYYYYDNGSNQMQERTFYFFVESDFNLTLYGKILLGFTQFFLNFFLTLVIGVTLNIVGFYQYKSYLSDKRKRDEANFPKASKNTANKNTKLNIIDEEIVVDVDERVVPTRQRQMTLKELNEQKAEKNMFYMALHLCSISIFSRIVFIFSFMYLLAFKSLAHSLFISLIFHAIYTLVPTVAIFVFYSFNKMFREEFNKIVFRK